MRARIILARPNHTYDIRCLHNAVCSLPHTETVLQRPFLSLRLERIILIVSHKRTTPRDTKCVLIVTSHRMMTV